MIEAAREVFLTQGFDAPVSAVAERAGCGMGSLYRRYRTKEELLQRLCVDAMEQAIAAAEKGLRTDDPWDGLAGYVRDCVAFGTGRLAPVAGAIEVTPEMLRTAIRGRDVLDALVDRARTAGALRTGVTALDISLLIEQFGRRGSGLPPEEDENIRQRLLTIALDGLRARNPEPLPGTAPDRRHYESRWARRPAPEARRP